MYNANLGDLQSVLVSAMRCLECQDPQCVQLCSEHIDVPAAMRVIIARAPSQPSAWIQNADKATMSARQGIAESFE